jgi:hypothetical protein
MGRNWVGVKKLAVVPTFNTQFDPPPPDNWNELVRRRVFYDPDPVTGIDRSLRSYVESISYGRAILEAHMFPFAFADGLKVFEAAADSLPDGHGFEYLLCVIPMFDGHADRKGYFQEMTRNGVTFRAARVAMNDGPFREPMGVWAMEVLHAIAGLPDLYTAALPPGTVRMDQYDNMTFNAGTHSCAELKLRAGWIDPADVAVQESDDGGTAQYDLQSVGLSGPPPGRVAMVRSPGPRTGSRLHVEARLKSDIYERGFGRMQNGNLEFQGIPAEAVIVYEVGQAADDISLHTVLKVGERFQLERSSVEVLASIPEGFTVSVQTTPNPHVRGRLLSYGDSGSPGNVSSPVVVGLGGWQDFKFLFAGANAGRENRIYAVNRNGELLSYGDAGTPGNVSSPVIVGFGGWQDFKFLFAGANAAGENRIYAVNRDGELLSYGDAGTPGNVSSPVIVGFGGWQDFRFVFAGENAAGEHRIYAVNRNGELLSYGDAGTPGNVSSPVIVGFGGWQEFKFLFAGANAAGESRIYAVNSNGELLSYRDAGTPGNVSSPVIVGFGGWRDFKFLFAGANVAAANRIYAVVA